MGNDKALLDVDGQPLWRRQYNFLARAGAGDRMISARSDQTWLPLDVTRVNDATPDLGPLSGLAAALERCRQAHLLVLAVDMPRIPGSWIMKLRERCDDRIGAVGQTEAGNYEPLAAIYPKAAMLPLAKGALADRELSLQRLIHRAVDDGFLRVQTIAAAESAWFENWNEPGDVSVPR